MEISREYFSMLDYAVSKLTGFYRDIQKDPVVVAKAAEHFPWIYSPEHGLKFLVLSDVINCYRELGYERDLDTLEGLGLFMLTFEQGKEEDAIHSYERLPYLLAMGKAASKEVIGILDEQLFWVSNGTLISRVLEDSDETLTQRYYVLLYRFMSAVAKADGTVTEQ